MSVERAEIALDGEFFAAKEKHPHLPEFSWFKDILANDCIRLCGAGSLQQAHEIIEGKVVRMRREFFTDGVITATRWFDL
jgi:hypothetical protein